MRIPKTIVIVMLLIFFITPCFADGLVEDELLGLYGSEEFISIATGHKQLIEKAPAVATIITDEDIKKLGAIDIDEVLETVPGLHVARSYQGYNPIYTFRGIYTDFNPQVLMLVDGMPLSNLFSGNRTNVWAGLPIESVQRIEVVRGPGSAIYGADAFAGVINVITKDPSAVKGLEAGIRYGSFDTKNYFLTYGNQWNDHALGIYFEGYETSGQDETINADVQSLFDVITTPPTSASNAPGGVNLGRKRIDLRLNYQWHKLKIFSAVQKLTDAETGAGLVQALDNSGEFAGDRYSILASYEIDNLIDGLSAEFTGSYLRFNQKVENNVNLFPPGSFGPFFFPGTTVPVFPAFPQGVIGNPEVYESHSRIDGMFRYEGLSSHDITVGFGYYYGDLYKTKEEVNYCITPESCTYILPRLASSFLVDVSDTNFLFMQEGDRKNSHIYFQDVFRFANDWELTAGIRYDDYSDFGSTINPRFALVWSTTNKLTTKLLYGEAFRAPAFTETRGDNNPQSLGNPNLKPETLKSYELAFSYKYSLDLDYSVNAFYYEWNDIIQFIANADASSKTAQNFGKQTGYGLEAEAVWKTTDFLDIIANIAWQKSTNETSNSDAANAPEKQFYVRTDWKVASDTSVDMQVNWVMDRTREAADIREDIDDYVVVDLTLRRENIWDKVEVALIVKNLFDEDQREPTPNGIPAAGIPNDLPLAGRSILGEIRFDF